MQAYLAALTLPLFLCMVLIRAMLMRKEGIKAIHFGNIDRKDFLIPPFVLFYFYMVFANAFNLPTVSKQEFFQSEGVAWVGVALCLAGMLLFVWSMMSFGRSFRVGIDIDKPDRLVTSGVFAYSRNPIYVAFWMIMLGQFLVFPNWILLVYLGAGSWLFHRQVLREEAFLTNHYGSEYAEYTHRVRRYV
jgi:protein-S-isoprenylcysteine O-methyltransferase Ste14